MRNATIHTVRRYLLQLTDLACLIILSLYLIRLMQGNMFFGDLFSFDLYKYLIPAARYTAIAKLILMLPEWRKLIVPVLFAACWYISYQQTGHLFMLFLGMLAVACIDMDYRWALRVYVAINASLAAAAVLAGLCGATTVLVYTQNGTVRSSMGLVYPTDAASILFFIVLISGVLCTNLPDWILAVASFAGAVLVFYLNRSQTSTIMFCVYGLLLAAGILLNKKASWNKLRKAAQILLSVLFPLLTAFTGGLILLYHRTGGTGKMARLDSILHGRISLAEQSIIDNGLHAFGVYFTQRGSERSVLTNPNYNFVDNSYALMLLRCGWVLLALVCVLWCLKTWRLFKQGQNRAALAMAVIAMHSFSEHHFIEINFNIFLLLLFANFDIRTKTEERDDEIAILSEKKRIGFTGIYLAVMLMIGYLTAPYLITWGRTVCQSSGRVTDALASGSSRIVLFGFLLVVLLLVTALYNLYRLLQYIFINNVQRDHKKHKLALSTICFLCCGAAFVGLGFKGNRLINRKTASLSTMLSEETEVLELITQSVEGKVYADQYPAIYKKYVDGISSSVFYGDDLVRKDIVTVLVDHGNESKAFLDNGFLYSAISEYTSLYTNDQSVIDALLDAGYATNGFYSSEHVSDLSEIAALNNLAITEMGVLIESPEKSMTEGPNQEIVNGRYKVTWRLLLANTDLLADKEICTLSVFTNQSTAVTKKVLKRSDFDENGSGEVSITFSTADCYKIRFPVMVCEDIQLTVASITWKQNPEYDVRYYRDKSGQVIGYSFYDLLGYPTLNNDGYHACKYAYSNSKIVDEWYYDILGNEIAQSKGYWHLHRNYNGLGQIIREEYYDYTDSLVLQNSGYAAIEWEYNENGRISKERYFDENNNRIALEYGYSAVSYEYDDIGNITDEWYFDIYDHPIMQVQSYWHLHRDYNEVGQVIREEYFDLEETPTLREYGYAAVEREYNSLGYVSKEIFFDIDGCHMIFASGYSCVEYGYDTMGNRSDEWYYDENNQPTARVQGYWHLHRIYNEMGQKIREEYFDLSERRTMIADGYSARDFYYDEYGNIITETRYNEKDVILS